VRNQRIYKIILSLFSFLHENQRCIATLGEMIHTASLIHDDVVDSSDRRRGKPAAAVKWGPKKVIFLPYDYISKCH
jgi:geranylgeranyl pyrophosphate synthase